MLRLALSAAFVVLIGCSSPARIDAGSQCSRSSSATVAQTMVRCGESCWENPLPSGISYTAAAVDSFGSEWFVGESNGAVAIERDGATLWREGDLSARHNAIGFGPRGELWVAGSAGQIWASPENATTALIDTGLHNDITALASAAGESFAFDGTEALLAGGVWRAQSGQGPSSYAVGNDAGVWGIGSNAVYSRRDGGWVLGPVFPEASLYSALARPDGVWTSGLHGDVRRTQADGGELRLDAGIDSQARSLVVDATNRLIVVGADATEPAHGGFVAIFDLATEAGLISRNTLREPLSHATLRADGGALVVGSDGAMFALGPSGLEDLRRGARANLRAVAGSTTHSWAVGDDGAVAMQSSPGAPWSLVASGTTQSLNAIAAAGETRAIAVGNGGIALRIDGPTITPIDTGTTTDLTAVWADATEAWIVGGANYLAHLTADGVTQIPISVETGGRLSSVYRSADGSVWVTGLSGVVQRHSDATFSRPATDGRFSAQLRVVVRGCDVWGLSSGVLLHHDGQNWAPFLSPTEDQLLDIAFDSDDSFVVLGSQSIYRFENGTVSRRELGPRNPFRSISWTGRGFLLAGDRSAVIRILQ